MLPFKTVEKESFCELIASHNLQAKVMSNKKVKSIIINLESAMRDYAVKAVKGQSVCLTLDHWTSKAHHNYTGMTAHFIDDKWNLNHVNFGILLA
jgi:hypothetical protein